MTAPLSPNRDVLTRAARHLGPILDDAVFVGGQVTELLVTDPGIGRVRPTDDVDLVERLAAAGLRHDTRPGAPLCRFLLPDGIPIDVMPTDPKILGFSNPWYEEALRSRSPFQLIRGLSIPIPQPRHTWPPSGPRSILAVGATRAPATMWRTSSPSSPDARSWLRRWPRLLLSFADGLPVVSEAS